MKRYDVIVVLGAALGPEGDLGPVLAERVYAGIEAWRQKQAPLMLMTGKYEARKMKTRAIKLGVPDDHVLVETTALTTRENAVGCAEIMRAHRLKSALVVTQAFHRRRALAAFRRCGVEADGLRFIGIENVRLRARELVAFAVYKLRGWV